MGSNPIPRTTHIVSSYRTLSPFAVPLHFRYGYRILHKLERGTLSADENWIGAKHVKGFPDVRSAGTGGQGSPISEFALPLHAGESRPSDPVDHGLAENREYVRWPVPITTSQ